MTNLEITVMSGGVEWLWLEVNNLKLQADCTFVESFSKLLYITTVLFHILGGKIHQELE